MHTPTPLKVLVPLLVRPVIMHQGLIGFPHVSGIDYERGAEWNAVRYLLARELIKYWRPITGYGTTRRLYFLAPRDFDADVYQKYIQVIADGKLMLEQKCGFMQFFSGLTHDGGAQSGPHGNADAWLDFTQSGKTQNAVFWSFSMATIDALESALLCHA